MTHMTVMILAVGTILLLTKGILCDDIYRYNSTLDELIIIPLSGIKIADQEVELGFSSLNLCTVECNGNDCSCCINVFMKVCLTTHLSAATEIVGLGMAVNNWSVIKKTWSVEWIKEHCRDFEISSKHSVQACLNIQINESRSNSTTFSVCPIIDIRLNNNKYLETTLNCWTYRGNLEFFSESLLSIIHTGILQPLQLVFSTWFLIADITADMLVDGNTTTENKSTPIFRSLVTEGKILTDTIIPETTNMLKDVLTDGIIPKTTNILKDVLTDGIISKTTNILKDVLPDGIIPKTRNLSKDVYTDEIIPETPQVLKDVLIDGIIPKTTNVSKDVYTDGIIPETPQVLKDVLADGIIPETPHVLKGIAEETEGSIKNMTKHFEALISVIPNGLNAIKNTYMPIKKSSNTLLGSLITGVL